MAVRSRILLACSIIILLVGLYGISQSGWSQRSVSLTNGGSVRINTVSTLRELRPGATATIEYQPPGRNIGTITLLQNFYGGPILTIPSMDTNVLFCLYENEGRLRLITFDCSKAFVPFAPSNTLTFIVLSSPWKARSAEVSEWQEAYSYLKKMKPSEFRRQSTPTLSFGIFRTHGSLARLLDWLETVTSFTQKD